MSLNLSTWLATHGLDEFLETLLENGVEIDVVPALTEKDLIEIGLNLGQRKRFLIAAAKLRETFAGSRRPANPNDEFIPERRQLTVLFCDLVGSTTLSEKLDPEDVRDLLRSYQSVCQSVAAQFNGFVAQYLGDGVVIYFGYPNAHESDAQNAAQSALEIIAMLAGIQEQALQVRIGIASGEVVVGDVLVEGQHKQHAAIGQTPNLAARLMEQADAGKIIVSDSVHRLLRDLFVFRDVGHRNLKGFSQPEHLWQLLNASQVESRSQVVHVQDHLGPLVARNFEVSRLERSWEMAKQGFGRVAMISGEPGIGKSRLVQHFSDRVKRKGHVVELAFCAPNYQNTILHPFCQKIEREFDTPAAAPAPSKTDADTRLLTNRIDRIFQYLSRHYAQSNMQGASADRRRSKLLEMFEQYICDYAKDGPAILVIEDVHWSDSTTMELLGRFILKRVENLRLLVLITYRTGFSIDWPEEHYIERIALKRLSPEDCREYLGYLNNSADLPESVIDNITKTIDRVPLYIEEVFKATRENYDFQKDLGGPVGLRKSDWKVNVPTSLSASLMERLDRLGKVKRVAQVAATIGPTFTMDVLAKVSTLKMSELEEAAAQLVVSEVLLLRSDTAVPTYSFRHALLREVAYSSLLKRERQQLHAQIAQALAAESIHGEAVEPEVLGYHYARAGMVQRAIGCFLTAGTRAFDNSAYREAMEHVSAGLDLLDLVEDEEQKFQSEMSLRTTLAQALHALKGAGLKEVSSNYERARSLSHFAKDPSKYFSVLIGCWTHSFISANLYDAKEISGEILDLAQKTDDTTRLAEARRVRGMTALYMGDFETARACIAESLDAYAQVDIKPNFILHGPHPVICSEAYFAHALLFLGFKDRALQKIGDVVEAARNARHAYTETFSLAFASFFHQLLEDAEATAAFSTMTVDLARKHGFEFWAKQQTVLSTWAHSKTGTDGNVTKVRDAIDAYLDLGSHLESTRFLTLMAGTYEHATHSDQSLALLKNTQKEAERSGEKFYIAETHRIFAEVYSARKDGEAEQLAISHYRQALDLAERQNAVFWQLKTAQSIANHCLNQRRSDQTALNLSELCTAHRGGEATTQILKRSRDVLHHLEQLCHEKLS